MEIKDDLIKSKHPRGVYKSYNSKQDEIII
jgi:hypothetical protein